jgi:hypothetical protein
MNTIAVAIVRLKGKIFNEVENILEEWKAEAEEGEDYELCEDTFIKALGHCHHDMVDDFINYVPLSEIEKFINAYGVYEAMKNYNKVWKDRCGKVDLEELVETKEIFYRLLALEIVFEEMDVSWESYKKTNE